ALYCLRIYFQRGISGIGSTHHSMNAAMLPQSYYNNSSVFANLDSYDLQIHKELSEWVAFEKNKQKDKEKVIEWREPTEIFETTRYFDPDDLLVADRIIKIDNPKGKAIKIGVQFKGKESLCAEIFGWTDSWTSTKILIAEKNNNSI
ncbi:MAG: hypothetical protein V1933_06025, partial [Candidatus Omnitrophota bacterium]